MRKLLLLALASMLMPGLAAAATCTFNTTGDGESDWGPIITVAGAGITCVPPGAPASTDVFVIPDGATVTIVDDITFTSSADNGIHVQAGGSLVYDQCANTAAVTLMEGTAICGGIFGDVALCAAAGSSIEIRGGCRENGVDSPTLSRCDWPDYTDQVWEVDQIGVCGSGNPGEIGTCSGGDENLICLYYSDSRNNPYNEAADGDNYLDRGLGGMDATYDRIRFISGMEEPWIYEVDSVDATGPDYSICFDVTRAYDSASLDYPYARRAVAEGTITNIVGATETPVGKGATCVQSVASVLTTSGEYVGRCIRFCDAAGANCDRQPYKIAATRNALDCSGGAAAGDAIYLTDLNPLRRDLVASSDFTIDYCISSGDQFIVETSARFVDGTNADNADGNVIIGTTDVVAEHVLFAGPASVNWDTAAASPQITHHVDIADAGLAAGGPGLHVEDMFNFDMPFLTMSGGDGIAGGARMLYFDNVGNVARLENGAFRYSGQSFITTSADDAGRLYVERTKFEQISHAGAVDIGIMEDNTAFSRAYFTKILCSDCTSGSNSVIIDSAATNPSTVTGIVVWGIVDGGLGRVDVDLGAEYENMLARQVTCTRAGKASTCLPTKVRHCDIREITAATATMHLNASAGGILRDCILVNSSTGNDGLLHSGSSAGIPGSIISNVIIWNPEVTYACAGSVCPVVSTTLDNVPSTIVQVENVTIGWPEGTVTAWDYGFSSNPSIAETDAKVGGILVSGHQTNDPLGMYGIDIPSSVTGLAGFGDAGDFCVHNGSNAGGAYTYIDEIGTYPGSPLVGVAPEMVDANGGNYSLEPWSRMARMGCGAKTGAEAPGMTPNGNDWLYEAVGVEPPAAVINQRRTY